MEQASETSEERDKGIDGKKKLRADEEAPVAVGRWMSVIYVWRVFS